MKILQMTTYDVDHPNHGGKLRSHHIRKALRERFTVDTLSFEWSDHDDTSKLAMWLDQRKWEQLGLNGNVSDWGICSYLEHFLEVFASVCMRVREFAPDVLLIEQPFLWPLADRFFVEGVVAEGTKVVYSSHNVEIGMKRRIYQDAFPPDIAVRYTDYTDRIEKGVIQACVGALAVSSLDADYVHAQCPGKPVQVYINGHTRPALTSADEKWRRQFSERDINWVFVGSWHPPNINGLRDLLAVMPESIKNSSFQLWVLGSAGNGLKSMPGFREENYPWLRITGPVAPEDIDSAILNSSGIVLPIWEGGGSNLKTAQALLSCKCVVGSAFSFRGFEHYAGEAGVFLGNTPSDVAKYLTSRVPQSYYPRSEAVANLEWTAVLKLLPSYIAEILAA
jgi:hypothetical protein